MPFDPVIFDLGGVLFDWNPDNLYRSLMPEATQRTRVLAAGCAPASRSCQAAGRLIAEGLAEKVDEFAAPGHRFRPLDERRPGALARTLFQAVHHTDSTSPRCSRWAHLWQYKPTSHE